MKELKLQELKAKTAAELIDFAKENGVELEIEDYGLNIHML